MKFLSLNQLVSYSILLLLCACSTGQKPLKPLLDLPLEAHQYPVVNENDALNDYYRYQVALDNIKLDDDLTIANYLAQNQQSALAEDARKQWLMRLAKREEWNMFEQEYQRLPESARTPSLRCYDGLMNISTRKTVSPLARELAQSNDKLSDACNQLIQAAAFSGSLNPQDVWRRAWVAISYNQISDARQLSSAMGQELPPKLGGNPDGTPAMEVSALYSIISPYARNKTNADARLNSIETQLSPEAVRFAHGILGLSQAKDLNMMGALQHFQAANHTLFTEEQWQWYARTALRLQQWHILENIISQMPETLQQKPTWQYWQARALTAQNRPQSAEILYRQAAQSGRNFYAILAQEALGEALNVRNNKPQISQYQIDKIAHRPDIAQSLILFHQSQNDGNRKMRAAAQKIWRHALQNADETTLLIAAQIASGQEFYEMSIYSADRTNQFLDFSLRYPTPFLNIVRQYAQQNGIDSAWVYGLIRQESRFMIGAKSQVGASGLMQVMPGTARYIQKNISLDDGDAQSMNSNIQMGIWYLADVKSKLGAEMTATAGYNAGPLRPPRWQASTPLEGAIYAETIPFNETRDYVKKVMANTAYYSALMGDTQHTLTQHLGIVPAVQP